MEAPLSAGRERPDDRCFPKMLALWTVRGNRPSRMARSRHDIHGHPVSHGGLFLAVVHGHPQE